MLLMKKWKERKGHSLRTLFSITRTLTNFTQTYNALQPAQSYKGKVTEQIGGRVIGRRDNSNKLIFLDLGSNASKIQVLLNLRETKNPEKFDAWKANIKRGTIIGISGYPLRTKVGELSIMAQEVEILSQCTNPLPIMNRMDKEMLKDDTKRFQMRCLDFIVNPSHMNFIFLRSKLIGCLRSFLTKHGFTEVETPVLCSKAGGALAKPFKTQSAYLGKEMELRIAPELFLKELIVGGFERIFEIGKVFRNEGISPLHNPEFTMCEFYAAFQNYTFLLPFVEDLFCKIVKEVTTTGKVLNVANKETVTELDFAKPFEKVDIITELESYFNTKIPCDQTLENTIEKLYKDHINKENRKVESGDPFALNVKQKTDLLIKDIIESKCINPTFIMHHPTFMSPLAKACKDRPRLTERFELFANQHELSNGYSELDDFETQKTRFLEQQKIRGTGTDPELHGEDKHFIEVLKYGMPPTAGCGIGIDRLCMLLAGVSHIKEVIAFPHFRSSVVEYIEAPTKKTNKDQSY